MTTTRGFGLIEVLITVAVLLVLGGGAYLTLNPATLNAPTSETNMEPTNDVQIESSENVKTEAPSETTISWKLIEMDHDAAGTPHTEVTAVVNGKEHVIGTFIGSCAEIGASGGVDGTGLLAGELSAVQCWFAGGGDEIGIFAHEDGGYQILVGELSEPTAEEGGFRGDFNIRVDIAL